jgi:hypothetical protein
VRKNGDNNEKYVWLDEIGNHPDRQAERFYSTTVDGKSPEMTM